jgi:aminoglycoside 6-adenylyltransferase
MIYPLDYDMPSRTRQTIFQPCIQSRKWDSFLPGVCGCGIGSAKEGQARLLIQSLFGLHKLAQPKEAGNVESMTAGYEDLMVNFIAWAGDEENIRAALVIGSRARTEDHPADEWSDLDLLIVANDPKPLLESADWLREIGTPWIAFVEPTPGDGGYERRVLFEGGLDVDFAPVAAEEMRRMAGKPLPPMIADIFRRGARFILDKDGWAERFRPVQCDTPAVSVPSESDFLNRVNDFWYHTVWTAKKVRRGELWKAISCCNMYLKNLLREMMEWNARATGGPDVDTWMSGRFLEEWADPKAVTALKDVFAKYNEEDLWRALQATMDVFHDLAAQTAGRLKYPYPATGEEKARGLVEEMYSERGKTPQAD